MATLDQEIKARLKELGESQQAILEKIGALVTAQAVMQSDLSRVAQASEDTQRTLRGDNGDPGLVARVQNVERENQELRKDVKVIREEIYGKQDGQQTAPGVLERVRNVEGFVISIKNWGRLILGAILADLAVRIWPYVAQLFTNKP